MQYELGILYKYNFTNPWFPPYVGVVMMNRKPFVCYFIYICETITLIYIIGDEKIQNTICP